MRDPSKRPMGLPQAPRSTWPFALALAILLVALGVLLLVGAVSFAYGRLGLTEEAAFALAVLSLLGSRLDLPLTRLHGDRVVTARIVTAYGIRYLVPVVEERRGTLIAVNVGGALIPTGLSVWLLWHSGVWWEALVAALAVAVVVHLVARPIAGVGIVVPTIAPPAAAAAAALIVAAPQPAPVAYVAGTLGTLVGADLANLRRVRRMGAPIASIGGAGTFDAIFLSGLLAVVLAGLA